MFMPPSDIPHLTLFTFGSTRTFSMSPSLEFPTCRLGLKHGKGPVNIFRIPRPGFGKNLPEKNFLPLFLVEKKSSPPYFF